MPLTTLYDKRYVKSVFTIIGGGVGIYGAWLLNPLGVSQTQSVLQAALAGGLEVFFGIAFLVFAAYFISAVRHESVKHTRWSSMVLMVLWVFILMLYVLTNPWLMVVPLAFMFINLFGFVYFKSPRIHR